MIRPTLGERVNSTEPDRPAVPEVAKSLFGDGFDGAVAFVDLLRAHGVERGLIGPRELDRLWDRHVLNSVVITELVPFGATVIDVGSGGGFPGIPLALARPDLRVVLLDPMARRIEWLDEVVDKLSLEHVEVVRGRAEERAVRELIGTADVVTSRAVAPLAKLASWCLPLVRTGGLMLALKGASAQDEVDRDRDAVRRLGGDAIGVSLIGAAVLAEPTSVVSVTKVEKKTRRPSTQRKRSR